MGFQKITSNTRAAKKELRDYGTSYNPGVLHCNISQTE